MKIEKISQMALYICIGIILVSFALFLTIGYDNPVGDNNEPILTDIIMWLMYLMVITTAGLTIWSGFKGIASSKGTDPAASTGVPGGKVSLITWGLFVVSLVIGLVLGLGESDFKAADGTVTTAGWVTVVDAFCVSIGILIVAAAVAVAVSMAGILTKSAIKK
ncbi:MAG: hypothetical protein K5672_05325 [Bacteroidaceae bacterium]|jgi:hypothetical protein|nr:hypothetical protein [Bacteroidaceae bacterium]